MSGRDQVSVVRGNDDVPSAALAVDHHELVEAEGARHGVYAAVAA